MISRDLHVTVSQMRVVSGEECQGASSTSSRIAPSSAARSPKPSRRSAAAVSDIAQFGGCRKVGQPSVGEGSVSARFAANVLGPVRAVP